MKSKFLFLLISTALLSSGCSLDGFGGQTGSNDSGDPIEGHIHRYSDSWSHDETYHWHASICEHQLEKDKEPHTFVDTRIEPTFTEKGKIIHTCSKCEYSYEEEYGEVKKHTYDTDWSYTEYTHYHKCADEGYEDLTKDEEYHHFTNWVIDKEATKTESGLRHHTCSVCGFYEEYVIYSLEYQSRAFRFALNETNDSYYIYNFNGPAPKYMIVPSEYEGLPVTRIESLGEGNTYRVEIPDSIKIIDIHAFNNLHNLVCFNLPSSLEKFVDNDQDTTVDEFVHYITSNVKLEEIYNHSSLNVHSSSEADFRVYNDESKSKLEFTNDFIFRNEVVSSTITHKHLVSYIGDEQIVEISEKIRSIDSYAFYEMDEIFEISFDEVGYIHEHAFDSCSRLSKLHFESITSSIEHNPFTYLDYLKELEIVSMDYYKVKDGVIINNSENEIVYAMPDAESVKIPKTVTSIAYYAFYNHGKLKTLTCEEGTKIEILPSFNNCYSLESIDMPALNNSSSAEFNHCFSLKEIDVSSEHISNKLEFKKCYSLTKVKLYENFDIIQANSFSGCNLLSDINIPNCVTEICDYAFYHCTSLNLTKLPSDLLEIGNGAFEGSGVRNIKIPSGVRKIPTCAFAYSFLESVDLNCVSEIGHSAFSDCPYLKEINIPEGVTRINRFAFASCSSLVKVTLPSTLEDLDPEAFGYSPRIVSVVNKSSCEFIKTKLEGETIITDDGFEYYISGDDYVLLNYHGDKREITTPDFITVIGDGALSSETHFSDITDNDKHLNVSDMKIEIVHINEGVKVINSFGLSNSYIREVTLPSTLERIEERGIWSTNLKQVTIPSSVTFLAEDAVTADNIINLSNASWSDGPEFYPSMSEAGIERIDNDFIVDTKDGGKKLISYLGTEREVTIPEGITAIKKDAFNYYFSLCEITKLILPSSLTQIHYDRYEGSVFEALPLLEEIEVSPNNKEYKSVDGVLYSKDGTVLEKYPISKLGSSFEVPESVTRFNTGAFEDNKYLKNISMSDNVTYLSNQCFAGCESLEYVTLSNSLTEIPQNCFYGCDNLKYLKIPSKVTSVKARAFYCSIDVLVINLGLKSLAPDYPFDGDYGKVFFTGTIAQFEYTIKRSFNVSHNLKLFCTDGVYLVNRA